MAVAACDAAGMFLLQISSCCSTATVLRGSGVDKPGAGWYVLTLNDLAFGPPAANPALRGTWRSGSQGLGVASKIENGLIVGGGDFELATPHLGTKIQNIYHSFQDGGPVLLYLSVINADILSDRWSRLSGWSLIPFLSLPSVLLLLAHLFHSVPIMHPPVSENTPGSTIGAHTNGSSNGYTNGSISKFDMTSPSTIGQKFLPNPADLGVILVGFSGGQCKPGVDAAPTALVEAGLLGQLRDELGYTLYGDAEVHNFNEMKPAVDEPYRGMKNPRAVSAVTESLAHQVYAQAKEGRMVLTLGGDHSVAIGTIAGTARAIRERYIGRELAVIWVDAHADINTPETSGSGNVHGMPVAFATGLAKSDRKDIFGWIQKDQTISVAKLVYIGLRDVDRGEKKILRDNGIRAFSMHDIDRHGIGRVMEMALAHIGTDTPIHLSFDVDALDPMWAPSTGTPVRGGLTLREGDYIAECVHETGQLIAMDLVEVNPNLEVAGASETVRAGVSLVRCALGDTLL